MGNNRGAGPATPVPPVSLANKASENESSSGGSPRLMLRVVATEVLRDRSTDPQVLPSSECDDGGMVEIDANFRRKLWALRFLPRRDRHAALRAAQEERACAVRGLREKRDALRHWRRALLRLRGRTPGGG
jgi:hypothetical protein